MPTLDKKYSEYKTNWYDGWFFSKIIDPFSGKPFNLAIKKFIEDNVSVLDIGCGTGSLCLGLADSCSHVVGVDISPKMIRFAEKAKRVGDYPNVEFILKGRTEKLKDCIKRNIDYINLKMIVHEMDEAGRNGLMKEAKEISGNFIITEWVFPQPGNVNGIITNMVEFIAGKEHYRNFRDWCNRGGIDGFLERQKLEPIEEKIFKNRTIKIVKARLR